jgi:hypothetical protein
VPPAAHAGADEPKEPERIQVARRVLARHARGRLSKFAEAWVPEMRQLVANWEASQNDATRTRALKDAAAARVEGYLAAHKACPPGQCKTPEAPCRGTCIHAIERPAVCQRCAGSRVVDHRDAERGDFTTIPCPECAP